jgi:hypothetical protein
MRIRCRWNPSTELLPSDSPGIVDVFTGRHLETGVCLSTYCTATAVLVVRFEVSAEQRVYTPQYYIITQYYVPRKMTIYLRKNEKYMPFATC